MELSRNKLNHGNYLLPDQSPEGEYAPPHEHNDPPDYHHIDPPARRRRIFLQASIGRRASPRRWAADVTQHVWSSEEVIGLLQP